MNKEDFWVFELFFISPSVTRSYLKSNDSQRSTINQDFDNFQACLSHESKSHKKMIFRFMKKTRRLLTR